MKNLTIKNIQSELGSLMYSRSEYPEHIKTGIGLSKKAHELLSTSVNEELNIKDKNITLNKYNGIECLVVPWLPKNMMVFGCLETLKKWKALTNQDAINEIKSKYKMV